MSCLSTRVGTAGARDLFVVCFRGLKSNSLEERLGFVRFINRVKVVVAGFMPRPLGGCKSRTSKIGNLKGICLLVLSGVWVQGVLQGLYIMGSPTIPL